MPPLRRPKPPFIAPPIDSWFPVQVTDEVNTGEYEFEEVALDGTGAWIARPGGRLGTEDSPGKVITGTLAVDDYALARSAPTAAAIFYELIPLADAAGSVAGDCRSACGSLVGLASDATLRLELVCATGSFAAIDTDQFAAVYAFGSGGVWTFKHWVDGSPGSWQTFDLNYLGGTGSVVFTWNGTEFPTMTVDGVTITRDCISADGTFRAGPRNGITGSGGWTPSAECESNEMTLKVSCSCTPPDGWEGPGWYCADQGDGVEVLLLTDADICDDTLTIDSGPYDTEEDALAVCGPPAPVAVACALGGDVPGIIHLALTPNGPPGSPGADDCQPAWNGFTITATWVSGKTWVGNFLNPNFGTPAVVTIRFDADVSDYPTHCAEIVFGPSGSCSSPTQSFTPTFGPFAASVSISSFCCDPGVTITMS